MGTSEIFYMRDFFIEVNKVPVLSSEEQFLLLKHIRQGSEVGEMVSSKRTSKKDKLLAVEIITKAEESKKKLILTNMGLVGAMAKKMYLNQGLDFEDLVQEGILGLFEAIDTFDFDKDCAFSTHAFWKVRKALTYAIRDERKSRGNSTNFDDLPGLDKDDRSRIDPIELFADKALKSTEEHAHYAIMMEQIGGVLKSLNQRDKDLIDFYFNKGYTLDEVGRILQIGNKTNHRAAVWRRLTTVIARIRKKLPLNSDDVFY